MASSPPVQPHPTPHFSPSIVVFIVSKLNNRDLRTPSFTFIFVRSHGKAVLTTSLRSFVRKPSVCSPLRPDGLASLKFISEYLMNFVATCGARLRLAVLRLPFWVSPLVLPAPHTEPETQTAVPETRSKLRRAYSSPSILSVV